MSLPSRIAAAVKAGDTRAVVELLVAMPEKERRSQRERILELTQAQLPAGARVADRRRAAMLVWLGTSTSREIGWAVGVAWVAVPTAEAVEVLAARPTKIRDTILKSATRDEWRRWLWPVAFEFVRRGEFERPSEPAYGVGAVHYVLAGGGPRPDGRTPTNEEQIERAIEMLTADSDLLAEVIAAFEHEDVTTHLSHWGSGVLEPALVSGRVISRDAAIDVCLDGFLRDHKPSATRFFQRAWAELDVSDAELGARIDRLGRIGAVNDPGGQLIALQGLLRVWGPGVDPGVAAAAGECALTGSTKKLATAGMKLLARVVEVDPDSAVRAAATGLGHTRADVQEAALSFVAQHLDATSDPRETRSMLLGWEGAVEPQLRARLAEILGVTTFDPSGDQAGGDVDDIQGRVDALSAEVKSKLGLGQLDLAKPTPLPTLTFRPWEAPVLAADRRVAPIETVEEVVEAAIAALAGTLDGIDFERVLDGIGRFGCKRPPDAAASALRAQYESRLAGDAGFGGTPLMHLMRAWTDRIQPAPLNFYDLGGSLLLRRRALVGTLRAPRQKPMARFVDLGLSSFDGGDYPAHVGGFGWVRIWELACEVAQGRSVRLLATPTHTGGWIDPETLVDRLEEVAAASRLPARFDACQAISRLAPRPTARVGERLVALRSDVARAAARTLGADVDVSDPALARSADRFVDLGRPEVSLRVPDNPEWAASYALRFPAAAAGVDRRRDDPAGLLRLGLATPPDRIPWWSGVNALLAPAVPQEMSLAVTTMPRLPDLYGASVATTVVFDLNANRSSDVDHLVLAVYLDPDVPLGVGAHAGLAVSLAAKNESLATVGTDLFIDAATDGRLSVDCLVEVVVQLVEQGAAGLARIGDRLTTAASISAGHADTVRRFWQSILRHLGDPPRDTHAALQSLLHAGTLCGRGVDDLEARQNIGALATGSSKRARLARDVLDLPAEWTSYGAELAMIESRLDRAERWATARSARAG